MLMARGAEVSYNDPHGAEPARMRHHPELKMASQPLEPAYLSAQDCVLIATDHSAYDYDFVVRHSRLIIDTRNATRAVREGREKIRKA